MAKASRRQALENISMNSKKEIVVVEELGGEVLIKGLTLGEKMNLINIDKKVLEGDSKVVNDIAKLIVKKIFDVEKEEEFFSVADVDILKNDNTGVVEKIYKLIIKVSGLTQEAEAEIEKN